MFPARISAEPKGVFTVRFFSEGSVENKRLVPPMIPSISTTSYGVLIPCEIRLYVYPALPELSGMIVSVTTNI
jgi:hypothetical protein